MVDILFSHSQKFVLIILIVFLSNLSIWQICLSLSFKLFPDNIFFKIFFNILLEILSPVGWLGGGS